MGIETEFPQFLTPKTQKQKIRIAQARMRKKGDQSSSSILRILRKVTQEQLPKLKRKVKVKVKFQSKGKSGKKKVLITSN